MSESSPEKRRVLKPALAALAICFTGYCLVAGVPGTDTQPRNLHLANMHIRKIQPDWEKFCASNTNFAGLQIFAYTGGNGMIGVSHAIVTSNEFSSISNFLASTKPPRPLFLGGLRIEDEANYDRAKTAR